MIYYDKSHDGIYVPLGRDTSHAGTTVEGADAQHIQQLSEQYPGFTPDEVYAVIQNRQDRRGITRQMVRAALD